MAGRVNVKFAIVLGVILVAALGAAVWGTATVLMKSGEDHARLAREAEARGDWRKASLHWGTAVHHEQKNIEWLEAYLNAWQKRDPETAVEYRNDFDQYRVIIRALAEAKRTDPEAHRHYFDEMNLWLGSGPRDRSGYEFLSQEVDRTGVLLHDMQESDLWKTLRGYRGRAIAEMAHFVSDMNDAQLEGAIEDLRAALEAEPGDALSAEHLYRAFGHRAELANREGRSAREEEMASAGVQAAHAFAEANPESLPASLLSLEADVYLALRELEDSDLFGPELVAAQRAKLDGLRERAVSLCDRAENSPAGLDRQSLSMLVRLIPSLVPDEAIERLDRIFMNAVEHAPDDLDVKVLRAGFLKNVGRHPEAIEIYRTIADLEDIPVSAAGMRIYSVRISALYEMTDAAVEQWALLESQPEERARWLGRARELRAELGDKLAEDSAAMQFIDGRIAYAEGNLSKADRLLRAYNTATEQSNARGLRLAAEVTGRLGNTGEQRDLLERALTLTPEDLRTLLSLANVYVELLNYDRAVELLSRARDLRPDNEAIEQQLETIMSFINVEAVKDPVQRALAEAQIAANEGAWTDAEQVLRSAVASHPEDMRLTVALANILIRGEQFGEALEVIDGGLEIEPDNSLLAALRPAAAYGNDPDKIEQVLDDRGLTELEREISAHRLYSAAGEAEAAAEALAAARAIDPSDRQVVVLSFDEALRNGDIEEAERLYREHGKNDVDGVGGLAMRGRIEIARNDFEAAARTLETAVERGNLNPTTMRLLAQVYLELGKEFEALEYYKRAIAARPTEPGLVKGYISTLMQLGRRAEALDAARTASDVSRRDAEFRELWLTLEGMVGNKQLAYEERRRIAERDPDNANNTAALIRLTLDLQDFDEARSLLDAARAKEDSLLLASLEARWHADRNDLAAAAEVYQQFIISDANDPTDPVAYLTFGRFLIERGATTEGLTTLRQARRYQDPDQPVADAVLANELFRLRRFGESIEILESMLESGFQVNVARARLIEALVRLRQFDRAEELIDELTDIERSTLPMRLMRADIEHQQGRTDAAAALIDEAIGAYPNDAIAYMKRASLLMTEPSTRADAVEDLTHALELSPQNGEALRLRAMVLVEMGRIDDAVTDIVAAVESQPDDLNLLVAGMRRLIDLDRVERAIDLVDAALARRPTDLRLLINAGNEFHAAEQHRTALSYYERAWAQAKTFAVAQRLVLSLLSQSRPDIREARQIAQHPEIFDENNAGIYMLRARIESTAENVPATTQNLAQAYELIKENPRQLAAWAGQLGDLLGSPEDALSFLASLDRDRSLVPWAQVFRGQLMVNESEQLDAGLAHVSRMIDTTTDDTIRLACLKIRSMAHYDAEAWDEAAADMRRGLELNADDAELHNNLAYTLARHLSDAEAALPHAQRAVELSPDSRNSYDTLGVVHLELGDAAAALAALERALSLSPSDADSAPVLVHLARARLASGNAAGAAEIAERARVVVEDLSGDDSAEIRRELEQILETIRTGG